MSDDRVMQYWMIVHRPTGKFLAVKRTGYTKGYTFEEPTECGVPRLFTRQQDADAALSAWAKGRWRYTSDSYGEKYFRCIEVVPSRRIDEMVITPVVLNRGTAGGSPRSLLRPATVAVAPDIRTPEGARRSRENADYYRTVVKVPSA